MAWEKWAEAPEEGPQAWDIDRPGGTTRHVGGAWIEHGVLFLSVGRRSSVGPDDWVWHHTEMLGPGRWFAVRRVEEG